MFLILTLFGATNVVPVRRRKEGSSAVLECFHWEGGRTYFIHRFICLVKQLTVMTLFWKTRDRAGRDFKHLLGCAAFLEQLAERKLHSLQGMGVCLWLIPLELLEGKICFFGKFGGSGLVGVAYK